MFANITLSGIYCFITGRAVIKRCNSYADASRLTRSTPTLSFDKLVGRRVFSAFSFATLSTSIIIHFIVYHKPEIEEYEQSTFLIHQKECYISLSLPDDIWGHLFLDAPLSLEDEVEILLSFTFILSQDWFCGIFNWWYGINWDFNKFLKVKLMIYNNFCDNILQR